MRSAYHASALTRRSLRPFVELAVILFATAAVCFLAAGCVVDVEPDRHDHHRPHYRAVEKVSVPQAK